MQSDLFDCQVNGFAGVDFQAADLSLEDVRRAVSGLAKEGAGRFLVAVLTDAPERIEARFARLEALRDCDERVAEAIVGYHLEGPWLSPEPGYCGAHDARFMGPPDLRVFDRFQSAARGGIRLVTLAPEWPGSPAFIRELASLGIAVSLGHTNAGEREIDNAIEAGARFCTHLGNGVPLVLPRHDNVVQRLLARDELTAFFIPDGIHLPPFVLRNFFRAKPPGRALFTTDCMSAAGAPEGDYSLGALRVHVGADRVVRLPGKGGFAGSSLTPRQGVANVVRWLGIDPAEAHRLFSTGGELNVARASRP